MEFVKLICGDLNSKKTGGGFQFRSPGFPENRITSYNVCYTKLLRQKPEISKGIDWSLVWFWVLLCFLGIISIFGATYREGDPVLQSLIGFHTDYSKQFYFFVVSAVVGFFILFTDSKFFSATANLWYVAGIVLMILVFPLGTSVKGTESIIRIGGSFQFQPAEFSKICVCLALAKFLSRPETDFSATRSQSYNFV